MGSNTNINDMRLSVLRNLNSLTRLVQDLEGVTATRDLKNIEKMERAVDVSLERLKNRFRGYGNSES